MLAAAAVHLYTTAGGVLAFFATLEIAAGRFERALLLLGIAFAVDGTDGMLARRFRVREVLPTVDGEILDLVIDFSTYAVVPLFLLWRASLLPSPPWLWAALILIAAHYDFANTHPLKHRGLYTGLPAMWNLYAFHVFYIRPSGPVQMACIALLFVLTFAPVHFICLSRLPSLQTANVVAIVAYTLMCLAVLSGLAGDPRPWALAGLAYPAWYLGSSFWAHFRYHRGLLRLAEAR
ncbi:MAG: CDP-alcohol phosphatidyltransferase family protein [Acidobacteriota bacterium]